MKNENLPTAPPRHAWSLDPRYDPDESYNPYEFLTTAQQRAFPLEYIKDFNGGAAAIRAGYSPRSAGTIASGLLNQYNIALAIQRELAKRRHRTGMNVDMVLRELGFIALSDIGNYEIDDDGNVTPAEGAPSEVTRAIKSIKRNVRFIPRDDGPPIKEVTTEIVLWDKLSSLRTLAQHLGMLIERREISGPDGGPITSIQRWIVGGREIVF